MTGRAGVEQRTKEETSYSVTTIDEKKLRLQGPTSVTESLKSVPGFWVEASGGEASGNVRARGVPVDGFGSITLLLDGSEEFTVARLSVELLRSVPLAVLTVEARVVRPGRRVQLAEATLSDDDGVIALARAALDTRAGAAILGGAACHYVLPIFIDTSLFYRGRARVQHPSV